MSRRPSPPAVLLAALLAACGSEGNDDQPSSGAGSSGDTPAVASPIVLREDRGRSKIEWRHTFIDQETGSTYKLNPYDHGSGLLVADVDGDRRDDVYFLNFLGPNALYKGNGDGTFTDITAGCGAEMPRSISVGGCFGDIDNDGDQDLYVTTYRNGNHLFLNDGSGKFEDVTEARGVSYVGHSNSATFLDYDLDGDLDLYLSNIGKFTTDTIDEQIGYYLGVALEFDLMQLDTVNAWEGEGNILWRNDGSGNFEDVTAEAGVGMASWNGDVAVADYDLDGDPDLYVANMFGSNNLYRNDGDGSFTDVAKTALGLTSWGAIGCRFFDANNDGLAEIYVVDMHSDMWTDPTNAEVYGQLDAQAKYSTPAGADAPGRRGNPITGELDSLRESGSPVLFGNSYFRNLGGGRFEEASDAAGLETFWPWGIATADFDRDGYTDVFVSAGMSYPYPYWPNSLLRNEGGERFTDVSKGAGVDPPPGGENAELVIKGIPFSRSSRTSATLDLDGDGDLDLIVANFNDHPYVYYNESPAKPWLGVRLQGNGTTTARDATGCRVVVEVGGQKITRFVESATGYLSQSTRTLYFGLGSNDAVDRVTVAWLGGEEQDVTADVALGKVNLITQD